MTTQQSEFTPYRLISALLVEEMRVRQAALRNIQAIGGALPEVIADYEQDIVNMQETIKLWNRLAGPVAVGWAN